MGKKRSRVWIHAQENTLLDLERMLLSKHVNVTRLEGAIDDAFLSMYDTAGVLVVDHRSSNPVKTMLKGTALLPVLMVAPPHFELPDDALRISPALKPDEMAHHILELLAGTSQFRRYPRVPVALTAQIEKIQYQIQNASLYGVWMTGPLPAHAGESIELNVIMSDGAQVILDGTVVSNRDGGVAVRTRPRQDIDLVLWLHLILGELDKSPLYSDVDPFGPLFR